jgi:O-antigen/teichoic acid export membrane protein
MKEGWSKINRVITKFKDLTTLGFANVLASAISGVFWFYLASLLGTTHYGEVSYFIAIASIASTVSFLGASTTVVVYTAKGEKILSSIFSVTIITTLISSIVLFLLFNNIGVSLYIIGALIFGLATADLLGQKLYKNYSKYIITQKLLFISFSLFFYYILGPQGVILGYAVSFFPYLLRIYNGFKESKATISSIKPHVGFMINSYVLDLSRTFSGQTDKLIVAPLLGFSLLGNYQLGLQFLSLLGILPNIVYQYILPHDASGSANKKLKKMIIFVSIFLAILGIFLAPVVLPYLFPKFKEAVGVIRIISLAIIPMSINLIYISKFLGNEKSKLVLIGSVIYLSIQISSIIILGKMIGVNGVAIAVVIAAFSEMIYFVSVDRFIRKKTNVSIKETTEKSETVLEKKEVESTDRFHFKYSIPTLISIVVVSLLFRLYYFPHNIPLTLDALNTYFFYATDISILGHLPTTYNIANNGWPIFLSFFFTILRFDNALDYMTLQRIISISISVLTIIPVYLLCKRFFDKSYAIIGATIFAFEPRIIQNSVLGITDPLYIFLVASALFLFFSSNKKMQYASFVIVALSSIVRAEGLFVFFPMLIMFFVNHRKERRIIVKCALALSIFILIILPMAIFRIQTEGNDSLTSRITSPANELLTASTHDSNASKLLSGAIPKVENILKFSGWSLIPIFIFFLPIGLFLIFKKRNSERISIIVIVVSMMLPVIYGFSFLPDTRYIYPLFPLFCVISVFTVKSFVERMMKNRNIFLVLIIIGILFSSGIFLDLKKFDYEHQREAFGISEYVVKITKGVNDYHPESSYVQPAELPKKWPALQSSINFTTVLIPTDGFDSLTEYIKSSEEKGLTHLVLDGQKNRPSFLNDVFYHKEKYPYLVEVFDSSEHGFKYHVKIYKIDYTKFQMLEK